MQSGPADRPSFNQPYKERIIHVRWSGEGLWIPLGEHDLHDLKFENQTSHPAPGHIILYPGGLSEVHLVSQEAHDRG